MIPYVENNHNFLYLMEKCKLNLEVGNIELARADLEKIKTLPFPLQDVSKQILENDIQLLEAKLNMSSKSLMSRS